MKPRSLLPSPVPPRLAGGTLAAVLLLSTPLLRGMAGGWAPPPMAPKITRQPASVSLYQGQTLTLAVTAEAYPAPTYQWRRNGASLQGATSTQFSIPSFQPADAGRYEVVVSNRVGHVTSQTAVVALLLSTLPSVTREPVNATVALGGTASFSVVVAGTPAPAYQWRKEGAPVRGATGAILTLYQVQPSDEGAYDVLISNPRGTVLSRAATLRVIVPTPTFLPPRITAPPADVAVAAGGRAVLAVSATGDALSYQWRRNGVPLADANAPTLDLGPARASDMGFYSVVVTGAGGRVESGPAIVTVATPGTASILANLSTRGLVPPGGALTLGFTWQSTAALPLLARGVGPALGRFGVREFLADPTLELVSPGPSGESWANNDWGAATTAAEIVRTTAAAGAFPFEDHSRDAAVVVLPNRDGPRPRTLRVTAADGVSAGTALAEIYAPGASPDAGRFTSLSTLGWTGPEDRRLVAAFVIAGTAPQRLLLRAIGPGLAGFGVQETAPNPRFTLWAAGLDQPVVQADDWSEDESAPVAARLVGAFPLAPGSRDAARVVLLPPGTYSVVAEPADGLAGVVLVEVYDLGP
jgi:hypothetical protein